MHAILDSDFSVRLTLALAHFLWQGLAVALLAWIASACLKRAGSRVRYLANLAALCAIGACLPATFLALGARSVGRSAEVAVANEPGEADDTAREDALPARPIAARALPAESVRVVRGASEREPIRAEIATVEPSPATAASKPLSGWIEAVAPYATTAYFLGVLAMLVRLAMALWGGQRLRAASQPVTDDTLRAMIQRVAQRVGLKTAPAVAWCQRATVPVVVGVARPLILLPSSLASGLVPDQIESLLTHELAHIRRHDLWVNLLQRLIEAAFFFHPAVWYVSRRVSLERENCCDDFVLSAGWPRVQYADALVRMAELCLATRRARTMAQALAPQPTLLAASGESPSQFKRRVLRLLEQEPTPTLVLNRAGVLALVGLAAAVLAAPLLVGAFAGAGPAETDADAGDAPLAAAASPKDAWPQWGGSALRNHASPVTGLPASWDVAKKTNVTWTAQLGTATYASPIVSGDKVLIGTNNAAGRVARFPKTVDVSCLQCFDRATGRFLWQYSSEKLPSGRANDWPAIGMCGSPCVEGDRLWLMTNRCEVVCLDLSGFRDDKNDGPFDAEASKADDEADLVWRTDLMKELGVRPFCQSASSVTLAGELVLVNTSNGVDESHNKIPAPDAASFVALDRHTGRVVWSDASPRANLLPTCPSSSPAVARLGGAWQAIFAGGDGWLYSFDLVDVRRGKTTLLWKFDCNPKTSRWQLGGKGDRNTLIASPVVNEGRVYIAVGRSPEEGDASGHLWCIDPTKRGDISPELVFNRADPMTPIAPKRWQACDTAAGDFTRANANSGAVWHYESFDQNGDGRHEYEEAMHRTVGSVSLADGLALVADLGGILHCLDARTGRPYWSHDLQAAVWSTPLVADGRVYVADEDGDVAVFRLAKKKELLAEFNVEHPVYGSFAAADGSLFLATSHRLLAIARPAADERGGAEWPLFRRGADARGTASGELPAKPDLLWKRVLSAGGATDATAERDAFEATAAIAAGTVYVGSRDGVLYALHLASGDERWRFKNAAGFSAPPSVHAGMVYLGDSDGKLRCLDAGSGELKWTFAAQGAIDNGANFFKDRVIFGSQDASLYCLSTATGKLLWRRRLGDQIRCFPTIEAGRIFVAGCDGKLHVLDAETGDPAGKVALDGPTGCTPAVLGDRLFVGTDGGGFFGIDWREAKIVWTYQQPGGRAGYRSSSAATGDVVVVSSRSKLVAGLNPRTGEQLWAFNPAAPVDGSPTIAGGRAYFGTTRGRLHALDIKTGKQVWEHAAGGGFQSSPAVAGGRLVIASDDGVVYCFGAKAEEEESTKESPVSAPADAPTANEPLAIDNSLRLAVKYIESQQTAAGDWGKLTPGFDDGRAALGTLALVRAGRRPADQSVKRALDHLAGVENSRTYTVALQTVLLAAVDAKKHRERIARNVKWLADVQTSDGDARGGWSYGPARDMRSDGSNSRFAAWALDAARRAGVAVPEATWRMAAEYWLKRQAADGSWGYQALAAGTPTMTTSGIASLAFVRAAVPDEGLRRRIDVAIDRAWKWHDAKLGIGDLFGVGTFPHYYLQSLSTAATMTSHAKLRGEAWRPEVVRRLVAAQDAMTGAWTNEAEVPLIATSWAVLFLTEGAAVTRDKQDPPAAKPGAGKDDPPATDGPAKAPGTSADSARIVVKYDIADAEADAKIYVQDINGRGDIGTETLGLMKWNPLKNGGTLELKDLAAGDYQVARYRQVEIGRVGTTRIHSGMYLDRRKFKLKDGETVAIDFIRPKSRPVKGRVLGLKEAKLEQAVVCVCSENAKDDESTGSLDVTIFDARRCDKDGSFQTERLAPGKYALLAQGYEPWTEEELRFTGIRRPRYLGLAKLTVPETGEVPAIEVTLRDTQAKAEKTGAKETKKPGRDIDAPAVADLSRLDGAWVIESFDLAGKPVPEDVLKRSKEEPLVIEKGRATASNGMTFVFEATLAPFTMTGTSADPAIEGVHGIWKVVSDVLTVCRTTRDRPLPDKFSSTPENGWQLRTYARQKADRTAAASRKQGFEPFECETVDAVTGKPITDVTVHFLFKQPATADAAEDTVSNWIYTNVKISRFHFVVPDDVLRRPELVIQWSAGHPDYEPLAPKERVPLAHILRDDPKSARDTFRRIALKPKKGGAPEKGEPEKPGRATSVSFHVLDRTGQKPIPSFRVIPGHRPQEGDPEKPVWQREAARAGSGGYLAWPLVDLDDREWAFLVEADGHESQYWTWIKKADGRKELVFLMAEAPKVTGADAVWGSLTVRFVYDGPRPKPAKIEVTKDVGALGREVLDESLVVGGGSGLANVVVYLTSKDAPVHPGERKRKHTPAELKVVDGLFRPRVLPIQLGQKLSLSNPLPVAVNFHFTSAFNAFNYLVAAKGSQTYEFTRAERFPMPVQCDIHPWMRAYLLPLDHPYAAVSGKDGVAQLHSLPAGEWTFRFWHEKAGFLKGPDGKPDFSFRIDARGGRAEYRVSPEFALKPAEDKTLADDKKPAEDKKPGEDKKPEGGKEPAPKGDAGPKAEQNEATKRALADFKKRYALADSEDLKFIPAPTPDTRLIYLREELPFVHRSVTQLLPARLVDCALFLQWDGGLKWGSAAIGSGGVSIRNLADHLLGFKLQAVEGEAEWLDTVVPGDFVRRQGVPPEKLLRPLEAILREHTKLPLKLAIRELEREVYVAKGEYALKPLPDGPKDEVQIYGRELDDPKIGGGGTGNFDKFLESLGAWISVPLVADVKAPPKRVSWHYNLRSPFTNEEYRAAKDPETVLKNVSDQTGLTFEKAKRPIRVLSVEK